MWLEILKYQEDGKQVPIAYQFRASFDDVIDAYAGSEGEYGYNSESEVWIHVPGKADYLIRRVEAPVIEVPNLDHITDNPAALQRLADVFKSLELYARCKANAMSHRLVGTVEKAPWWEERAHGIYQELPDWAKW